MANIEIYFSQFCPYCQWARSLLDGKKIDYTLHDVTMNPGLKQEMRERSQRNTVPQIFINGLPIGGFDELSAMDRAGKLDAMLAEYPSSEPEND